MHGIRRSTDGFCGSCHVHTTTENHHCRRASSTSELLYDGEVSSMPRDCASSTSGMLLGNGIVRTVSTSRCSIHAELQKYSLDRACICTRTYNELHTIAGGNESAGATRWQAAYAEGGCCSCDICHDWEAGCSYTAQHTIGFLLMCPAGYLPRIFVHRAKALQPEVVLGPYRRSCPLSSSACGGRLAQARGV